ncbi:hypothetical protein GGX14DRAFT_593706 [Mycena pura]|uniref:Uncharacterized protein n=1 Tax=Mycena pura TaxID=153505 RepID=A0AAD6UYB0_9AGAR|nr:hypothetical protein GGX14DRAFT_593706 [Mycena pura]
MRRKPAGPGPARKEEVGELEGEGKQSDLGMHPGLQTRYRFIHDSEKRGLPVGDTGGRERDDESESAIRFPWRKMEPGDDAPRSVSERWFNVVCPPSERRVIAATDIKPAVGGAPGDVVFAHGQQLLHDAPERCIEVVTGSLVFDLGLWGTPRVLALWDLFATSPTSRLLGPSPIVQSALARNSPLFVPRGARAAVGAAARDPYARMLAVHLRRGDYEVHCHNLAAWGAQYYGWAQLPLLPDKLVLPDGDVRAWRAYVRQTETTPAPRLPVHAVRQCLAIPAVQRKVQRRRHGPPEPFDNGSGFPPAERLEIDRRPEAGKRQCDRSPEAANATQEERRLGLEKDLPDKLGRETVCERSEGLVDVVPDHGPPTLETRSRIAYDQQPQELFLEGYKMGVDSILTRVQFFRTVYKPVYKPGL